MVQTTDFTDGDNLAQLRRLDRPPVRRILSEGKVGPGAAGTDAKYPVRMVRRWRSLRTRTWLRHSRRIDPMRRSANGFCHGQCGCREDFVHAHALHAVAKLLAIHLVTVAQEIGWRGVARERIHNLLGIPNGGGMFGDVEVDDAPAVVGKHNEDEEDVQADGGDGEEIDGDQIAEYGSRGTCARFAREMSGRFGIRRETVRSATSIPRL